MRNLFRNFSQRVLSIFAIYCKDTKFSPQWCYLCWKWVKCFDPNIDIIPSLGVLITV